MADGAGGGGPGRVLADTHVGPRRDTLVGFSPSLGLPPSLPSPAPRAERRDGMSEVQRQTADLLACMEADLAQ